MRRGQILVADPPTVRAPDAAFVTRERLPDDRTGVASLAPYLAVEVVSPSNTFRLLTEVDTLDGGKVLPGFSLPVAELFEV